MKREDILALCRLYIPEAPISVISSANAYIILNNAALEFVDKSDALPTYTDFNLTADTQRYALSTVVPTYLKMRKEGIWLYDDSNTSWKQLDSITGAEMNKRYSTWLNDSTAVPQRAWIDGDYIYIHPKGDSTSDDIRVYHYAKSTDVDTDGEYFFSGSTTQYSWLAPYEETLIEYYKARVYIDILGGNKIGKGQYAEQKFYAKCLEAKNKLQYRSDLIPFNKIKIPSGLQPSRNMFKV